MDITEARHIVKTLADGIDPESGEFFADSSPFNQPRVLRALYAVLETQHPAKRQRMTLEERRQANLDHGRPRNSGLPWTDQARDEIAELFKGGSPVSALAQHFERSKGSIVAELLRQELIDGSTGRV